ncbi:YbaB/EbfC family DNA-binding protein [Rhodococcus sp. ABRD24]|uniref:YbaB/EbfC family nucleoid-associated protein n=1 Tax=Rhodococcus sp. ABRD24 TaxID=2507582 RepID=UPI00103A03F6|nr:YbaB/EbfC family nucleoid-associated protein [Rhodococcus sp. ABRD24]QBJ95413.1 YbaB/EbfC family DNA-binding protein [Rhodococcus sp. ABRD24]
MSEREMDALVARATAQVDLLEETLTALQSIRAVASSEDGRVRAEVDGHGTLTGLWLSESLLDVDARALAQTITHTAHRAAAAAAEERIRVTTALYDMFAAPSGNRSRIG